MTLDQTADLLAAARRRIEYLENEVDYLSQLLEPKPWEAKFPHVPFTDKVQVKYSDGQTETFKHLYNHIGDLETVDWNDVVDCYEV